jgi:hypothetical protein
MDGHASEDALRADVRNPVRSAVILSVTAMALAGLAVTDAQARCYFTGAVPAPSFCPPYTCDCALGEAGCAAQYAAFRKRASALCRVTKQPLESVRPNPVRKKRSPRDRSQASG